MKLQALDSSLDEVARMAGLMDIFIMKDRVKTPTNPIFVILEKASILIALLIVFALAVAINLPEWAIGVAVGLSLGPIVYGHYYFLYIRPILNERAGED
jgi:membrane associated rhomboid family serine protease